MLELRTASTATTDLQRCPLLLLTTAAQHAARY